MSPNGKSALHPPITDCIAPRISPTDNHDSFPPSHDNTGTWPRGSAVGVRYSRFAGPALVPARHWCAGGGVVFVPLFNGLREPDISRVQHGRSARLSS